MNPRHIAYAISDHAAARVREAYRYLVAWSSLRASGVPALQLRHVLDLEAKATEARRVVDEWTELGSRGLIAVIGAQDCGKSDAAVRWALARHRKGLPTTWIHAVTWGRLGFGSKNEPNEIAKMLREAEHADALVIDDVGAGDTEGELFKKKMRGLILERDQRPTLISGNLNETHLLKWVGERIKSRLHESGRIKHIPGTLELRKDDGVKDPEGRSPAWFAARKMVDFFGCERVQRAVMKTVTVTPDGGEPYTYEEATGEYEEGLDVGERLAASVKDMSDTDALAKLKKTAGRMGVNWADIEREAKRLGRLEELGQLEGLEAVAKLADSGIVLKPMPKEKPKIERDLSMGKPPELGKPAEAFTGEGWRYKLHAAGFRVERVPAGFKVLFGESVLHTGLPTKVQAWEFAAGMTAEPAEPCMS